MKERQMFFVVSAVLVAALLLHSCAARKPEVKVEKVPERVTSKAAPRKEVTGMKGTVLPVDSAGEIIPYQSREAAVITVVPVREGRKVEAKSTAFNPLVDGNFFIAMKDGDYFVEVFLKGFHVVEYDLTVEKGAISDLGTIKVTQIESGGGEPIKGDRQEEVFPNEGDVNIQPPVS